MRLLIQDVDNPAEMIADDRPEIERIPVTVYFEPSYTRTWRDGLEQAVGVARRAKWVGCGDGQIELRKFPNTSTWKAWDTKADYPAIIGWGIGQIR